jgi:hypothetical protein
VRYDSGQFQSFDGLDNRRELMVLFQRLGTDKRRVAFLKRLIAYSKNGFAAKMVQINPVCDPVTAYFTFVAITGCLGVNVDEAAKMLDREVSRAGCTSLCSA